MQALIGLTLFVGIVWLFSENRKTIPWKVVAIGIGIQVVLALLLLHVPFLRDVFLGVNQLVGAIDDATQRASAFMFGFLAGGDPPYTVTAAHNQMIIAFRVLPLILVVSAISSVLFHWGVLPLIIRGLATTLQKVFPVSGALGFGAASTLFLGTIEAPLLIKPYLKRLSRSELFALICCTLSTIAGTVMVLYASVTGAALEGALGHLLIASIISIPAALVLAMTLIPPEGTVELDYEYVPETESTLEALVKGTTEGLTMVLHITAIIIVLFALVHLSNMVLAWIPSDAPLTIESVLGWLLRPVMWLTGIPWSEAGVAGNLMGTKIILNEFVAYLQFSSQEVSDLSNSSRLILTYALCGFANLGSAGIVIGGLGSLVPERRAEIASLTLRALVVGNLATLMTAAVIGLIG